MLPDLSPTQLVELFRRMLLIRRFEERLALLSAEGHKFGHYHLYIGEEVTGVGALDLLRPDDYVLTTHRNHGHLLARGADPAKMFAEILGRATGYSGGKSGTLHLTDTQLGFLSTSAVVGGAIGLSVGAGLAAKRQRGGRVAMVCFGDGAMEEGVFPESLNMAALYELPVVFLCENNSLEAAGTKAGEYSSSTISNPELTAFPRSFKIPATQVDGTDLAAVRSAVEEAVGRARSGEGPAFVEARTVRWPGSRPLWPALLTGETDLAVTWDPSRLPSEYRIWHEQQDGVLRTLRDMLAAGAITPEQAQQLDAGVNAAIKQAAEFAVNSPLPEPASAHTEVFA